MTRKDHIYQLKQYLRGHTICMCPSSSLYWKEHYEEIIKVLEQEPTTKNDLGVEYISRSELMAILSDYYDTTVEYRSMLKEIAALPSATPQEPKTGHWIKYCIPRCGEQHYQCTNCDEYFNFGLYSDYYRKAFKFCPNCGCRMTEQEK